LNKLMSFRRSAGMRPSYFFLTSLLLLSSALLSPLTAPAQETQSAPANTLSYDVALSGFGQVTGASNGNNIVEDTSESMGGLLSFRGTHKPLLGFEANYDFTRYSEFYNKGLRGSVQNNVHELTLNYMVEAHTAYGFQLFATIGGGIMVFDPTSKGGNGKPAQLLPAFDYGLGLNHNVLSDHIGIRVQYRYVKYKTPNFHEFFLDTQTLRRTMEPSIGVYYRFR
jgi:opacity protein-like surface antigen